MSKTKKKPAESNINTIFRSAAKFIFDIITWFFRTLREAHTKGITGILCWVVAIYLAVAFISYIMSWGEDQSYAINTTLRQTIIDSDTTTQNAMGRMGSYVSHWIFYEGFGIASFIIVILLWLTGNYWLFKNQTLNLPKSYRQGILSLFLFSVMLSYFFTYSSNGFPFGGSVGQYINEWLQGFIGSFGTFLALLCLFAVWLVMILDIPIDSLVMYVRSFSWQKAQYSLRRIWQQAAPVHETNPIEHTQTSQPPTRQTNTIRSTNTNNNTTANTFNPLVTLPTDHDLPDKGEQQDLFKPPTRSIPLSTNTTPHKKSITQNEKDNFHINQPYQEPPAANDIVETDEAEEEFFYNENVANANPREEYDPTLELVRYKKPVIDLLDLYGRDLYENKTIEVNREELERNKEQIEETLLNYAISISSITATPGPTVTLYEIVPAPGVRISRIKNLEDDIALSLAALGIRIIAPMPGKGTIGIEVPNQKKEIVSLRSILMSDKFQRSKMELPIGLGKTISDEPFVADLAKMPHLLLAGATGQGKSVCLNVILMSLLFKKHPAEIKFVLIDPKKVELSLFSIIEKHFLAKLPGEQEPIVTDTKKVIHTLNALCIEMDQRYDLLKRAYVRNVKEYNAKFKQRQLNPNKGHRYLPYFILVIDEFADLIMTAGKEVEMPIARLAQLSRAVGLHLIIATQRPTVNIITGTIKANFPVRIAFRVTAKVDSRTILDQGGANQLIGSGDMLLSMSGDIVRLQCAFVDTPEVERVTEFIGEQMGFPEPFLLPEYRDDDTADTDNIDPNNMELDDLFEEAARVIVQNQQGSTSLIQRRMKLGYNRAGRLMDQLEAMGIVGQNLGSKAREVLILDEFELDQHLERIRQRLG